MSFRARLTLYFLLIVALPMVAIAVLVSSVASDSATGKTDAALDQDLEVAARVSAEHVRRALAIGSRVAADPAIRSALAQGDADALDRELEEIARERDLASLTFELEGDAGTRTVGARGSAFAAGRIELERGDGTSAGALIVSTISPADYLREVRTLTGEDPVLVIAADEVVGATAAGIDPEDVPEPGDAVDDEVDGEDVRVAATELSGAPPARVALVAPTDSAGFLATRPGIAIAVGAFILLALVASGLITRTLQGQVASMLTAARRIGEGDFSGELPVVGNDELAGLAREFNEMRDRLSAQMDQLRHQRSEIERSVSRIGEAFASGLDRPALLRILVETAIDACEADYAIVALSGHAGAEAEAGSATDPVRDVALAAEERALREIGAIAADGDGAHALAGSLGRIGSDGEPLGAMTVARSGRAFTASERDVFLYLVGQAAASVENVALHELVSEQAVTDDLTGLANNRAFRDAIEREAARAARFRHELSLLVLDIDDFKQVNDTHGHLQGDAVLRMIGEVLAEESREIDLPARYGGEEFVVALPETGEEGAMELAQRIRTRIAKEAVERIEGRGKVRVTVSIGVATMPGAATEVPKLIAAADAALYDAKRGGKNEVVTAEGNGAGWRTDAE